jgi:trimethylamine--corrinoid protein Co-methyltransferase
LNILPKNKTTTKQRPIAPTLNIRTVHTQWQQMELRETDRRARQILKDRLSAYQKPDIDPSLERELIKYVDQRKANKSSIIQ